MNELCLLAFLFAVGAAYLLGVRCGSSAQRRRTLHFIREQLRLRLLVCAMAARIAEQSELLGRKAEKREEPKP